MNMCGWLAAVVVWCGTKAIADSIVRQQSAIKQSSSICSGIIKTYCHAPVRKIGQAASQAAIQ
jgi:hypothetical protein